LLNNAAEHLSIQSDTQCETETDLLTEAINTICTLSLAPAFRVPDLIFRRNFAKLFDVLRCRKLFVSAILMSTKGNLKQWQMVMASKRSLFFLWMT
jgi:hypothetical protein